MKKITKSFLLVAALFAAGPCLMQGRAEEALQTPAVSDGVTITETTQADGTLVETVNITELPRHYDHYYNAKIKVLRASSITLAFNQQMIIAINIDSSFLAAGYPYYDNNFTFDEYFQKEKDSYENEVPIIKAKSSSPSNQVDNNPLNAPWYNNGKGSSESRYCKVWIPQSQGDVTLKFHGNFAYLMPYTNDQTETVIDAVVLKVPVTVVDPQATPTPTPGTSSEDSTATRVK